MVHDFPRALLRLASGHAPDPMAAVLCRGPHAALHLESGHRAGYDGAKRLTRARRRRTRPWTPWAACTSATEQDRAQEVEELARWSAQEATGEEPAEAKGVRLEVVKHPSAEKGFVLLRRWMVERRASPGRRASGGSDYERLAATG